MTQAQRQGVTLHGTTTTMVHLSRALCFGTAYVAVGKTEALQMLQPARSTSNTSRRGDQPGGKS